MSEPARRAAISSAVMWLMRAPDHGARPGHRAQSEPRAPRSRVTRLVPSGLAELGHVGDPGAVRRPRRPLIPGTHRGLAASAPVLTTIVPVPVPVTVTEDPAPANPALSSSCSGYWATGSLRASPTRPTCGYDR
jgi:hypothetical protein